jgi:hypothetical protein
MPCNITGDSGRDISPNLAARPSTEGCCESGRDLERRELIDLEPSRDANAVRLSDCRVSFLGVTASQIVPRVRPDRCRLLNTTASEEHRCPCSYIIQQYHFHCTIDAVTAHLSSRFLLLPVITAIWTGFWILVFYAKKSTSSICQ